MKNEHKNEARVVLELLDMAMTDLRKAMVKDDPIEEFDRADLAEKRLDRALLKTRILASELKRVIRTGTSAR